MSFWKSKPNKNEEESTATSEEVNTTNATKSDPFNEKVALSGEGQIEKRFGKLRSALGPGTIIQGKLSFDIVGVVAKLSELLANADIPIFVVSTYDTDYVLMPGVKQQSAAMVLEEAGYEIV